MSKTRFNIYLVALCTLPLVARAAGVPQRITTKYVDLSVVQKIHLVPGMATLLEIPGPVTGVRVGDPDSLQYFKPERPDNEVTLVLKGNNPKPTNLIVRSNQKKYVFDIKY